MLKDNLIAEWKRLRGEFFNILDEDIEKFRKKYSGHPLYNSIIKYLNTSFRDINQIAKSEIDKFLKN